MLSRYVILILILSLAGPGLEATNPLSFHKPQVQSKALFASISISASAEIHSIPAEVQAQATPVPTTAVPATATPLPPTPTPRPPTPAPTPAVTTSTEQSRLPIVPIFLGLIFLGLVLAVVVPIVRSRLRRR